MTVYLHDHPCNNETSKKPLHTLMECGLSLLNMLPWHTAFLALVGFTRQNICIVCFTILNQFISRSNFKTCLKMRNSNFSCKNEQLSAICKHTSVDRYRITILTLIYTDGCETWGAFLSTKDKIFNINHEKYSLFDEPCFEKLDIKYLKTVLGVHRKSCNAVVRGELGRYPITIYTLKQVVKNWLRMEIMSLIQCFTMLVYPFSKFCQKTNHAGFPT